MEHDAINLSQGYPDFAAPAEVKEAARQAIADDINQYPITWGAEGFREAIAGTTRERYGMTGSRPAAHHRHVRFDRGDDRRDARRPRPG